MDPNFVQKRMQDIQRNETFADAFSKIISGRPGYKAVIETKKDELRCRKCKLLLEEHIKFCPECGTKVWIKPTKCPKCNAGLFRDDKFCQECGENVEPPPLN